MHKETLARQLKNFYANQPYRCVCVCVCVCVHSIAILCISLWNSHAMYYVGALLVHPCWINSELESAVDSRSLFPSLHPSFPPSHSLPPSLLPLSLSIPPSLPPSLPLTPSHSLSLPLTPLYLHTTLSSSPSSTDISAEQLQLFIPQLLSAMHIEALVIGNVSREVSEMSLKPTSPIQLPQWGI